MFGNRWENQACFGWITLLVIFFISWHERTQAWAKETFAKRITNEKFDSKVYKDSGTVLFGNFSTVLSTEICDREKRLHSYLMSCEQKSEKNAE